MKVLSISNILFTTKFKVLTAAYLMYLRDEYQNNLIYLSLIHAIYVDKTASTHKEALVMLQT